MTPYDSSPNEVESREELAAHLAAGRLAGLTVQGLRLDEHPPDLSGIDVTDTYFVGCHFASKETEADLVRRGAYVVPPSDRTPYPTHPARLYTPDDLAAGFATGGFGSMYDTVVYRHFLARGGALADVREALAQRLHDHGIDNALNDTIAEWLGQAGPGMSVGVMGGHAVPRGSHGYAMAAALAWRLTRAGRLVITGGGPGVMEAANLGAYLGGRSDGELTAAIDLLAKAPDFRDHDAYTELALEVRGALPPEAEWPRAGGLSVPTWLYGHEPANLFAGRIAKYFSNAIREDMILRLARGGIVFAPGRAGTLQEVFQAATKTFYATDGASGPYVFLDKNFWTRVQPVEALLRPLLAKTPHGDLSSLIHLTDDVDEALAVLTAPRPDATPGALMPRPVLPRVAPDAAPGP